MQSPLICVSRVKRASSVVCNNILGFFDDSILLSFTIKAKSSLAKRCVFLLCEIFTSHKLSDIHLVAAFDIPSILSFHAPESPFFGMVRLWKIATAVKPVISFLKQFTYWHALCNPAREAFFVTLVCFTSRNVLCRIEVSRHFHDLWQNFWSTWVDSFL